MKNKYKRTEDCTIIYLNCKDDKVVEVKIDNDDFDKILNFPYKWYAIWFDNIQGYYAKSTIYLGCENGKSKNKVIYLHRYLMDASEEDYIDHINHNTLDNRRANLRVTTNDKNTKHRHGKNKNNKSGYRNVSWLECYGKWCVQLQVNGKNTLLGKFDDVDKAGQFAEEMRQKYYGKFKGAS